MHPKPKHDLCFYYDTLKTPKLMSLNENSKNYGSGISSIVTIVFIIMAIHEVLQKCFGGFFYSLWLTCEVLFFICGTVSALAVRAPPPSAGRGTGSAAVSAQPSHAVTVVCRDWGQAITEIICPRVNLLYPGQAEPQADRDRCASLSTQSHRRGVQRPAGHAGKSDSVQGQVW